MLKVTSTLAIIVGASMISAWHGAERQAQEDAQAAVAAFEAARIEVARREVTAVADATTRQSPTQSPAPASAAASTRIAAPGPGPVQAATSAALETSKPDTSRWSPGRVAAWEAARGEGGSPPEGVLRIPAIDLEVPVYEGATDLNFDRGAGRIAGTAPLGASGNSGIASHRDGFFRVLDQAAVGQSVLVDTLEGSRRYRIADIRIVSPDDVHVLAPRSKDSVTLVTCYPFYRVGPAPQRYIVTAEVETSSEAGAHASGASE